MILLDIINGIDKKLIYDDSIDFSDYKSITLRFINNYENYDNIECEFLNNIIDTKNIKKNEIIDIKCKILDFLGAGSYGKVYKLKINDLMEQDYLKSVKPKKINKSEMYKNSDKYSKKYKESLVDWASSIGDTDVLDKWVSTCGLNGSNGSNGSNSSNSSNGSNHSNSSNGSNHSNPGSNLR